MDKDHPYFSVIIPTYNRPQKTLRAIESVIAQSDGDFEIVVVDDGSTDDTEQFLTTNISDGRMQFFRIPHRGRSAARNYGLDKSRGEWICFLDSDDAYRPSLLAGFRAGISELKNVKALVCEQTFNGQIRFYEDPNQSLAGHHFGFKEFAFSNPLSLNQLCFSGEINVRFPEEIDYGEDWFFFRALALQTEVLKIDIVGVDMDDHDERSMNSVEPEVLADHNYRATKILLQEYELPHPFKRKLMPYTALLSANMILSGRGSKAKALRYFFSNLSFQSLGFANFYRAIFKFLFFW